MEGGRRSMKTTPETILASRDKSASVPDRVDSKTPDWVKDTPPDAQYDLGMYVERGEGQEIILTREEYIALKQHLAALRGHTVGELNKRVEELTRENAASLDPQQTAMALQTAREYYRRCPDLVV